MKKNPIDAALEHVGNALYLLMVMPCVIIWALLWSPFFLIGALFGLTSSGTSEDDVSKAGLTKQPNKGESTTKDDTSATNGSLGQVMIWGSVFGLFVLILFWTSRRGSTVPHSYSSSPQSATHDYVWVNAYFRDDGTYVAGHYRTSPDEAVSNNWSTKGNVNPFTGEQGSRRAVGEIPQAAAIPQSYSTQTIREESAPRYSLNEQLRIDGANRIKALGVDIDWRANDLATLNDAELRINTANRLAIIGVNVDWNRNSLAMLLDFESRANICERLRPLGVEVDWKRFRLEQLLDIEQRVSVATRLSKRGLSVDWKKHSLTALLKFETSLEQRPSR